MLQELHHLFAGTSHLGPTGIGVGILLEAANVFAVGLEVDLRETIFCGAADGVLLGAELDEFDEARVHGLMISVFRARCTSPMERSLCSGGTLDPGLSPVRSLC